MVSQAPAALSKAELDTLLYLYHELAFHNYAIVSLIFEVREAQMLFRFVDLTQF